MYINEDSVWFVLLDRWLEGHSLIWLFSLKTLRTLVIPVVCLRLKYPKMDVKILATLVL